MLISKFRQCSDEVKKKLFRSYCTSFYGCCIWSRFTKACIRKLNVAYKRIFRGFMKRDLHATTYQMLELGIDSFDVIIRKLTYGFYNRIFQSDNYILKCILGCDVFYATPLYKRWLTLIY